MSGQSKLADVTDGLASLGEGGITDAVASLGEGGITDAVASLGEGGITDAVASLGEETAVVVEAGEGAPLVFLEVRPRDWEQSMRA
jgi:hypothetical protein